jgi:hypothetical protein
MGYMMPTPSNLASETPSIPDIVDRLRKRSKRSYAEVCERIAAHMGIMEYSLSTFNNKFRPKGASSHYETIEMVGLIKGFVDGLSESQRCRADEAFELFDLAHIAITDFEQLKRLFPSQEYAAAWTHYTPTSTGETPTAPADDPDFLKPYYPQIFIGRDKDVIKIKTRLGVETSQPRQPITVIRGWPGVGKTTLVNRLAHDEALIRQFSDGVLWTSLGKDANIFGALKSWLNQLDMFNSGQDNSIDDLVNRLRVALRGKNVLLIVDDLWTKENGEIFKRIVTEKNTLMMTTRFTAVAKDLAETPENVYILDVLSDEDSLKLLRRLTPEAVKKHERSLGSLIKTLEGLPLALRVAGSLLEKEQTLGLDVEGLIRELTEKHHWIQETAPTTYFDEETGQTPTIALLFQKSVETLQPTDQEAFANLGIFASKPATFDLKAIAYVCELDDPIPTLKALVDHGLLEPLGNARFQMHYTLSLYAKSLQDP